MGKFVGGETIMEFSSKLFFETPKISETLRSRSVGIFIPARQVCGRPVGNPVLTVKRHCWCFDQPSWFLCTFVCVIFNVIIAVLPCAADYIRACCREEMDTRQVCTSEWRFAWVPEQQAAKFSC